jgi:EAL domain-containing protein (putative c-di-GMP-specific phosphodiesterase class I)
MDFPILGNYLHQLRGRTAGQDKLWIDTLGRVQGQFLNCSLTSVFQGITSLDGAHLLGFEAHAHSYSALDSGLSVWKLLMNAASDDESVELDRLARMIHVINFFRQPEQHGKVIFIDVHNRLLTAVSSNHGAAFRRIVSSLGLPPSHIILQVPHTKVTQNWALTQVVDNYKLNGFPVATRAIGIDDALHHVKTLRPAFVHLDISRVGNGHRLSQLIECAAALSVQLIFGRIEYDIELDLLRDAAKTAAGSTKHLFVQGPLIADPHPGLALPWFESGERTFTPACTDHESAKQPA